MCIVIDTCCLASVFDSDQVDHTEYEPVLRWITEGRGKMVFGGKRYGRELARLKRYQRIWAEFARSGKIVRLDDEKVDAIEEGTRTSTRWRRFNDHHVLAIVIASGVKVVCTRDRGCGELLKHYSEYPRGVSRPRIYKRAAHATLLNDRNIANVCS